MSNWPTQQVPTGNFDADTDTPSRDDLLKALQALNLLIAYGEPAKAGRLINVKVYNNQGTFNYVRTDGTVSARMILAGGGGQGGGTPALASGQGGVSSGGNSGAGVDLMLWEIDDGVITVGRGGSASGPGGDGENGYASTFISSKYQITMGGGVGGRAAVGVTNFPSGTNPKTSGTAITVNGSGSKKVIAYRGSCFGDGGVLFSQLLGTPGKGAPSYFGEVQPQMYFSGGVGGSGSWPCGGGCGSLAQFGLAQAGAPGADGFAIVYEFS
jgi:hypothetical protein